MFTALALHITPWFLCFTAAMRTDEVSSTGGWFWWWALAGWTFPSFESVKCYHRASLFKTNLVPVWPIIQDVETKLNPRWIRSVERTSCRPWTAFVGLLGGGLDQSIQSNSSDVIDFLSRQRAAWNVKQWVLHLPAFVDTGWLRKPSSPWSFDRFPDLHALSMLLLHRYREHTWVDYPETRPRGGLFWWFHVEEEVVASCHVILRVLACLK